MKNNEEGHDECNKKLIALKKYVSMQAEDEILWFNANSIGEAYLQQELRHLASLIEDCKSDYIEYCANNYRELHDQ